jgi:hypothetical protein
MSLQYLFCLGIDFWLLSSGKIFSEGSNGVKAEKKMINLGFTGCRMEAPEVTHLLRKRGLKKVK